MQIYDFPAVVFLPIFQKIHKVPFTLPVSFFQTLFWLELRPKTQLRNNSYPSESSPFLG